MAYTITQKPTTPNAAYTRLLYVVSGSSNTSKPQFQYVMDVYESGSSSRIYRTTQTINPAGVAVFDPSRVMQGELVDEYSWKISSVTPFDSSSKTFRLEFGEQYASSISSSVSVVDNIERTNTEVFRGVVEPNSGYFNWQSSSYAVLSNMPATMSMQNNDNGTIGIYNNDVSYISQSYFATNKYSGSTTIEKNYNVNDNFVSVPVTASGFNWGYADVEISSSIGLQKYRYENSTDGNREKTRFAFINKLGTWDYYNNYNPVRQAIDITREQYTAPRVDYSSLTSVYDIERRGRTDIHNTTDDTFVVDTDLLNKTNANWIEELIESPSVYIQRNGEFIPIIITDSSYVANQNQARQKQFKYTITFKPSNQPFGKWEPEFVPCNLPTGNFDPSLGGVIDPVIWWDFTDNNYITYSGSIPSQVTSKGTLDFKLIRPIDATTNPVVVEDEYMSIYGLSFKSSGSFDTKDIIPFNSGSSYSIISFHRVNSGSAASGSEFTLYEVGKASPGSSTQEYQRPLLVQYENKHDALPTSKAINTFLSNTTSSFLDSSSLAIVRGYDASWTGEGDFYYIYTYSGSSLNETLWESYYTTYDQPNNNLVVGRDTYATSSKSPANLAFGSGNGEGVYIGRDVGTGREFDIAHILIYTGSLPANQVQRVIESFKGNVPYFDEVNSVNN